MKEKHISLGIDGGGSSSRWCLCEREVGTDKTIVLARGKENPITGHVFTAEKIAVLEAWQNVIAEACQVATPQSLFAGITGLNPEAAQLLSKTTEDIIGLPKHHMLFVHDLTLSYYSVFKPGEGILLYAGTGSIACHITETGEIQRKGGYGYLIDDAGGGYWIGRQALKNILQWHDIHGTPSKSPLALATYEFWDADEWSTLMPRIYSKGRKGIAAMAPMVIDIANQGDTIARDILAGAAEALAGLVLTLLTQLDKNLPVVFAGGIAQYSPQLLQGLRQRLPDIEINTVKLENEYKAAEIGLDILDNKAHPVLTNSL